MKLGKVLKGKMQKFDIEQVSILTDTTCVYSGCPKAFFKPTGVHMILLSQKVQQLEIKNTIQHQFKHLFIFVDCFDF